MLHDLLKSSFNLQKNLLQFKETISNLGHPGNENYSEKLSNIERAMKLTIKRQKQFEEPSYFTGTILIIDTVLKMNLFYAKRNFYDLN